MNYEIIAISKYGIEVIDQTDSLSDAEHLQIQYRIAFGIEFTILIKKIKNNLS